MASGSMRNKEAEITIFRERIFISGLIVVVLFLVLIARMVYLQVVKREHYFTLAESNRISVAPLVPQRGLILDRNGEVLAANFSAFTLEVTPSKVADLEKALDDLSNLIDVQARDRRRFKKLMEESRSFESLPIRNRLTETEVARFSANKYRFPGFEIRARLFRNYPFGDVASHAIGYIGRINDTELKKIELSGAASNYKGSDHIGKLGIEGSFEAELHGVTGSEQVEIDAGGRAIRSLARSEPTAGNNLVSTIDIKLQRIIEKAFKDSRGTLVAIEPATGDILALVSQPRFDPNLFVDGIDPTNWDALNTSIDRPLLNRALKGAYPPGSTLKPFLALNALESGKRTPDQAIRDVGYFAIPGVHRWMDDKVGGHGTVDMYKSIVESCNTYYYQLAFETDIDVTAAFLGKLGIGTKTGIDIEGEVEGILPSRSWKEKRFARASSEARKWYTGDSISAGIGQGYNAYTALQMAHATAIIANNGIASQPRLIRQIRDAATGLAKDVPPVLTKIELNPQNLAVIQRSMEGVAKEGTSARVFAKAAYVSAGKTGTAQVFGLKGDKYIAGKVAERLRDHAWYIAYAPADKPTIALAVLVENAGFGAATAAPIAKEIFDYYLDRKPDTVSDAKNNSPDEVKK